MSDDALNGSTNGDAIPEVELIIKVSSTVGLIHRCQTSLSLLEQKDCFPLRQRKTRHVILHLCTYYNGSERSFARLFSRTTIFVCGFYCTVPIQPT
jgi:hypothetical protein